MKVYDPRLDTAPGAHPRDQRYHVETTNPALLFASLCGPVAGQTFWETIVEQAIYCEAEVPAPMTEARARTILGEMLHPDDKLKQWHDFSDMHANRVGTGPEFGLDGYYNADELEAIAWWLRNKAKA